MPLTRKVAVPKIVASLGYNFYVQFDPVLEKLRRRIVMVAKDAGEGHLPSSLSVLELLFSYYELRTSFFQPGKSEFILSKGHASLSYFAVLEHFGYLTPGILDTYAKFDSPLGGHPDRNKIEEVQTSSGSLGHGLPFATGILLGNKQLKKEKLIFVLIGDGEINEGSNWESLLLISHHNLSNLRLIIDANKSSDRALRIEQLREKLEAFGLLVTESDGHDCESIGSWMRGSNCNFPKALIAHTIKGHGFSLLENNPAWHHKSPTSLEVQEIFRSAK